MNPRLKALELHGYKTFASKNVFEFPGNITAIVGPNGSGNQTFLMPCVGYWVNKVTVCSADAKRRT